MDPRGFHDPDDDYDEPGVMAVPSKFTAISVDREKLARAHKVVVLFLYNKDEHGSWSDVEEVVVKSNGSDK